MSYQIKYICELAVDGTGEGEDNQKEKIREDADIWMYLQGWNFLPLMWYAVVMVLDIKIFVFSICLKTFKSCGVVVANTVEGNDN